MNQKPRPLNEIISEDKKIIIVGAGKLAKTTAAAIAQLGKVAVIDPKRKEDLEKARGSLAEAVDKVTENLSASIRETAKAIRQLQKKSIQKPRSKYHK